MITRDVLPTLTMGVDNLLAHKLRSLLTMLGMIFGVAAVVAMLSIGAGAQQQVMALIEAMGVRNLIVESRPAPDQQAFQRLRQVSAGPDPRRPARDPVDRRRRRRVHGAQALHPVEADPEAVRRHADRLRRRAVVPGHRRPRRSPKGGSSRPTTTRRPRRSRCSAKARAIALFGGRAALGEHVKVNEQWLRVVGVCGSRGLGAERHRRRRRPRIATT